MALKIYDTLAPQGDYPAVKAESVEMPDGSRLSDFKGGVTSVNGQTGDVNIEIPEAKDGVSPTVTVTAITGGHRVTIKDATGTKTFDVMDGEDASVTVDSALSPTSENPIQNKAVAQKFASLEDSFSETIENVTEMIPGLDTTLSEAGKAADAGAVGAVIQQAKEDVGVTLQLLQAAIPTDAHINDLIDAYLSEALGGDY